MLAMDMGKARDTLDHFLALAKLKAYGFSNSSLDLTPEKSKSTAGNGSSGLRITQIQLPSLENSYRFTGSDYFNV